MRTRRLLPVLALLALAACQRRPPEDVCDPPEPKGVLQRPTLPAQGERGADGGPELKGPELKGWRESRSVALPGLQRLVGHPAPPVAARYDLPRELLYSQLRDGRSAGHYAIDGHLHSTASGDSRLSVARIVARAAVAELDAVVITDHSSIGGRKAITQLELGRPAGARPLVILGEEAGAGDAHMGLWNVVSRNRPPWALVRPKFDQSVEFVGRRNPAALKILNHPGWRTAGVKRFNADYFDPRVPGPKFDAIELWNGRRLLSPQTRTLITRWEGMMETGLRPSIVSGSDAHSGREQIGTPRTIVISPGLDAVSLVESARAGRTYLTDDARISFTVGRHLPGETIHEPEVRPPWPVRIVGHSQKGGTLRLLNGRHVVAQRPIAPGETFEHQLSFTPPDRTRDGYLRVEIVRRELIGTIYKREVDWVGLVTAPVYYDVGPQNDFWLARPRSEEEIRRQAELVKADPPPRVQPATASTAIR